MPNLNLFEMEIEYEVEELNDKQIVELMAGCWGHCCDHGGYGHTEW